MMKTGLLVSAGLLFVSLASAEEGPVAASAMQAPSNVLERPAETQTGRLARHTFTSAIEQREPTDYLLSLGNEVNNIHYFTDVRGMQGQTIMHRWEYAGQVMAEVPFHVQGQRWRVWSSKNLNPEWIGEWTVTVLTTEGDVLGVSKFTYMDNRTAYVETP